MKNDKKNPLEAIYFPVRKVPASDFSKDGILWKAGLDHQIQVKTPNGWMVVSPCSEDYTLISNQELLQPFVEALGGIHKVDVRVRHVEYSKFYLEFIIKDKPIKLKKDDIFARIYINNSYDRSVKYTMSGGLYRVFCDNGASAPVEGTKESKLITMMHTPGCEDNQALVRSLAAVDGFLNAAPDIVKRFLPMMENRLNINKAMERMEEVKLEVDYPAKLMEKAAARLKLEKDAGYEINDYLIYQAMNYALFKGDSAMLPHKMQKMDQEIVQFLYDENK